MSSEETINTADIFLREVPNVKASNTVKYVAPKLAVKEEMKTLTLNKKSQNLVMETLRYIHGDDFHLKDASTYKDNGMNISHKYWVGRGNLVIKGFHDYSNSNKEPDKEVDRLKMFALLRLESYGFHKEHCHEALDHCEAQVEDSLKLLYEKYYKLKPHSKESIDMSEEELLEQRIEEKAVLESIYESSFNEKIVNGVWIITLKLDYIVNLYCKKIEKKQHTTSRKTEKKKEMCRSYLRGQTCKFGNKCRFSHTEEQKEKEENPHLNNYTFELEIRFPKNTKYPFEAPLIFIKSNAVLPPLLNLHICKRLHEEALSLAADGVPSIYSIIELLRNEADITDYLKNKSINFLSPDDKLFPTVNDLSNSSSNRPTHYKKGATNKDGNSNRKNNNDHINKQLLNSFLTKQNDPIFNSMQRFRKSLPAWTFKEEILDAVRTSQVVIISGETGCGKSTQVPQFIIDDWLFNYNNDHVNVVCTQPRRISAIGVAERVSDERVEKIGNIVGYQIRLESKISHNTRLTFCTTGILLRKLEMDPMLANVTHVIVDEVHERSEESDFLLLILKELLSVRSDLKVILMSATLNAEIFSNYFKEAPVLEIPGRTFPVKQIFLEDILEFTNYVIEENSPYTRGVKVDNLDHDLLLSNITKANVKPKDVVKDESLKMDEVMARYDGYGIRTCKNLYIMDTERINLDLIETVLCWITNGEHHFPNKGSILVFLPGIAEITDLYNQLSCHPEFSPKRNKYLLIPLHSSLTSAEQALVFKKPKDSNIRKIVLSTNIAETSITIDDCVYVIDAGKMKEKHFDSNRNMESLETVWVTRANAMQRKGRAGRVMSGVCIHLYTSHRFKFNFLSQPIPEIQRVPLEQVILNIKVLSNFKDRTPHEVLGNIIEPPLKDSIDNSITRLQHVGALDRDNNLTALGHHLAILPVDVKVGKLMLFGAIFSCVDSALTIAACLSYKNPFVAPFGKKELANMKKKTFALGLSDQMTMLEAYNKFQEANNKSYTAGLNFARENYLSHNTLVTIADIKFQFLELLVGIGFLPVDVRKRPKSGQDNILALTGSQFNHNGKHPRVLSSILCAALYPNVVKILSPEKTFISSAAGAIPKRHEPKDFKFKTKQEQVFIHPSSVLFEISQFPSTYLVYQEKVKTSKIFIRDCCIVPIVPLVLFSGFDVNISVHNGSTFLVLDENWIMFEVEEHKIAEMIKMVRSELLDLLEEKIKDPLLDLHNHDKGKRIISTILQLVYE